MCNVTWRELIRQEMVVKKESWKDLVEMTLSEHELDVEFDPGFGCVEGIEFTLWTKKRVYFPACYDGAESVESVSRNPCDEKTFHVGGGG